MTTRILIVAREKNWFSAIRVPHDLHALDCRVDAVAHPDGLLARSLHLDHFYALPAQPTLAGDAGVVLRAIETGMPAFILPGDDMALSLLHAMEQGTRMSIEIPAAVHQLLRRSLGDPAHYATLASKRLTTAFTARHGIRVPEHADVASLEDARHFAASVGGAIVLKMDGLAGGLAVATCRNPLDVAAGYARLRDAQRQRKVPPHVLLSAQRFIEGTPAAWSLAALEGKMLAGKGLLKVRTHPGPTGQTSVAEPFDHPEMAAAAERFVAASGLSGIAGLDFMIERATGHAYLIECNPRLTQLAHLPCLYGIDLCAALVAALAGRPYAPREISNAPARIALYPHESWRDARSEDLRSAHVDAPDNEPLIMRLFVPHAPRPRQPPEAMTQGVEQTPASPPVARILIVAMEKLWLPPVRFSRQFHELGCAVAAVSRADTLVARVRHLDRWFPLPDQPGPAADIAAIVRAVDGWQPDLVLPGDDLAYAVLQRIARSTRTNVPISEATRAVLRKSLGDPAHYETLLSKRLTIQAAHRLGIRVPEHTDIATLDDALRFAEKVGGAIALKMDGEAGGTGVILCRNHEEIAAAFEKLKDYLRRRGVPDMLLSAQRLIEGRPAGNVYAAWDGRMVAGMGILRIKTHPHPTGPSTVVSPIRHAEMATATQRFCAAVGMTGIGSAGFMIERDTGHAYMIECNTRMSNSCHTPRYHGVDLCAAMLAALQGRDYAPREVADPPRLIAYFPQEWLRAPNSEYLASAYVEGPFDEPAVLRRLVPDWDGSMHAGPRTQDIK